jgi:hypothetical protein
MGLTKVQKDAIDELIVNDKAAADIYNQLVRDGADFRDVQAYVAEEQTLSGRLNTITRIAKQFESAGTAEDRKVLSAKVTKIAKGAIKTVQQQAAAKKNGKE